MSNLVRANKVTVNVMVDGSYKADFYRTHKHICSVNSESTSFKPTNGITKSGARELFRAYVIENAEEYGVLWNPTDMRAEGNIRKASYETDNDLIEDAMQMILPTVKQLVDICKYDVEWCGLSFDEIIPATHTGKGTDLTTMGIVDGKYEKSGKWAWAKIGFVMTLKFKGEEIYMPINVELVSGQLKKPKMGITMLNEQVKHEIIDAQLATEEELDPPKMPQKKTTKEEDIDPIEEVDPSEPVTVTIEVPTEAPTEEGTKRRSRGKKNEEVAE